MSVQIETKVVVTVSEMARMVGLSRSRFYQLIGSAFPSPLMDEKKRPYYSEELQKVCLEVRRRNCGIDGKPILFYARRPGNVVSTAKPRRKTTKPSQYSEIVEAIRALGLTSATAAQVEAAISQRYKMGIA